MMVRFGLHLLFFRIMEISISSIRNIVSIVSHNSRYGPGLPVARQRGLQEAAEPPR